MRYAGIMKRTTVMLPDELDARLRFEARRRGVSIADLAREAIASYLPEPPAERFTFVGIGESAEHDTSERVDAEVARLVSRRHGDAGG
jgi:predicted transcriptional regulator